MAKTRKTKSKKNKTRKRKTIRKKLGGMYKGFRPQAQNEEALNSPSTTQQTPSTRPFNFSAMTGIPVDHAPIPGHFSFGSMMNKTNRPFVFSGMTGRTFTTPKPKPFSFGSMTGRPQAQNEVKKNNHT